MGVCLGKCERLHTHQRLGLGDTRLDSRWSTVCLDDYSTTCLSFSLDTSMKPRAAAMKYIKAKIALTECMQSHFKQLCQRCQKWGTCKVYREYVDAWINLQDSV
jgi:hypothetical protein